MNPPITTEYTLHSTPPDSPTMASAESRDAAIQAELLFLRQRNRELQLQVEKLLTSGKQSNQSDDEERAALSVSSGGNSPNGLHHRNIHRKGDQFHKSSLSPSPPSPTRRRLLVKAKLSDVDVVHTTKNNGHIELPVASKRKSDSHGTTGSGKEDIFDNECNDTDHITNSKGKKRSSDGGGNYVKALTTDIGDEEEGKHPRDITVPKIHKENDADENDDLIDDDSHNKHVPRIIAGSPVSLVAVSANFPPFRDQLRERSGWLIGLLFLQSCSSFIIAYNERFLQNHMVIVQFLTMLVGAGGNAGNQASVGVIRSLAVGTLNPSTRNFFLWREAKMALSLSGLIGLTGFIRAALFRTPPGETIAITASVFAIVAISVAIGSTLPLGMKSVGIDPCHSSTSIQVIMDILGVLITVCVSSFVLSFAMFQNVDGVEEEGPDS